MLQLMKLRPLTITFVARVADITEATAAVGESSAILLRPVHPTLPPVGVSMGMERGAAAE